jgi:predicted alpha/beta superfamily hydrolase
MPGEVYMTKRENACKVFLIILSIGIALSWLYPLPFPALTSQKQNRSSVKVYSRILGEERTISVSLPDGYKDSEKAYPVLYVLDAEGEIGFNNSISTIQELNAKGLAPKMILVGIWNTNRNRDMIPEAVSHRPGSGGSERFLHFIEKELMIHMQQNYRVSDDSLLYGMSNSALFAVYALLEKPEAFHAVIASSPMIGHCPEYMRKKAEEFTRKKFAPDLFLYMIYGTQDTRRVTDYVPDFQNYLNTHALKGFTSKLDILEGEGHVPKSSLSRGLQSIFAASRH